MTKRLLLLLFIAMQNVAGDIPEVTPWKVAGQSSSPRQVQLMYQVVLEPCQRTSFSTELIAKVIRVCKRMGETFKEGDLLIELDSLIINSLVDKAAALVEKAEANFAAKAILHEQCVASFNEFLDAKTNLAAAEADLRIAEKNLTNTRILAPYDGRVANVYIEPEEYPNHQFYFKDKPMMEIVNDTVLLAKVLVPAAYLPDLYIGKILTIKIRETNQTIQAPIARIGAVIDPASSTLLVEAEIENFNHTLLPGMTGAASFELEEKDNDVT